MSGEAGRSAAGRTSSTTPGPGDARGLTEESRALARAERVRALGEESPVALEPLIAALDDPDALVRGSAVIALLEEEPELVLGGLEAARKMRESRSPGPNPHPGPRILEYELIARASMNQRLASMNHDPCTAALLEPDALVRSRAVAACVRVGSPDAGWLAMATGDTSWSVRARLATALSTPAKTDRLAAEALNRLGEDQHMTVRRAARRALSLDPR